MIKTMSLLVRRDGLSTSEFQTHWRDVHGPIAARAPGLLQYIQCHTARDTYRDDNQPRWDGVAELWWESEETLAAARESPEWQAVLEDGARIVGESLSVTAVERPIIDAFPDPADRAGMIKRMGFLRRRDGMSVEDFQRHWHDVHAPLVIAELTTMRRYIQAHVRTGTAGPDQPSAFDGVAQSWWDGPENSQLQTVASPDRPTTPAIADLANFAGRSEVGTLATREVVILAGPDR